MPTRKPVLLAPVALAFGLSNAAASKWVGACPAGMQPGDENQVQNGAFVKMGNITDSTPAAQ